MSRQIDVSDPENLSEDDLKYLRDRNRLDVIAQMDHAALVRSREGLKAANDRIAADNVKKRYDPVLEAQQVAARERARVETPDEVPPYEEWTRDELIAELGERGLSKQGKNDALIARLHADDEKGD